MIDAQGLQERYVQFPPSMRMGHLASDLARVSRWATDKRSDATVADLLDFAAWMLEQNPEFASEELANMQREICHWRRIWPVEAARSLLAFRARVMSERILDLSGLLEGGSNAGGSCAERP